MVWSVDSPKRKMFGLHRKRIPTGEPHIAGEVKRAKHLSNMMTEWEDMGVEEETEKYVEANVLPAKNSLENDIGSGVDTLISRGRGDTGKAL